MRYRDLIAHPQPEQTLRNPPAPVAIRRPWNGRPPADPGEPPTSTTPVKWIDQMAKTGLVGSGRPNTRIGSTTD